MGPLADPSGPATGDPARTAGGAEQGLTERAVRPFSLVGVVWNDPDAELHGTVQVRTRALGTGRWSDWQDLETHNAEHAADPGTTERESAGVHGSTAPLWVGGSDGVAVRVRPGATDPHDRTAPAAPLPTGLRLELVDPGKAPGEAAPAPLQTPQTPRVPEPPQTPQAPQPPRVPDLADAVGAAGSPSGVMNAVGAVGAMADALVGRGPWDVSGVLPALGKAETEARSEAESGRAPGAQPYIGPRPRIITRKGWGADESLRERAFVYTKTVKAAFIHHSATGNNYTCAEAPAVLRSIYRYHVKSSGWRDFGYNFAVDKCGNIYEGRAGGVTKPVLGAHTLGFNTDSMGIAVLGTFSDTNPSAAAVDAVARLTAWKLGLFGADPRGRTTLVSGGGNKFKKGSKVRLNVISGHRDGFATECPGARLYQKLGSARTSSARLQGR
ncbi:peptidoglycan recognition protein family protein [Streptomyces sp. PTD5-9]|uniref:peptidoglycan recognition protein family protein n=1 Tax=Streptomyces sp. PTD5-9 TaxID=3120150 RepID=UPI00300AB47E